MVMGQCNMEIHLSQSMGRLGWLESVMEYNAVADIAGRHFIILTILYAGNRLCSDIYILVTFYLLSIYLFACVTVAVRLCVLFNLLHISQWTHFNVSHHVLATILPFKLTN